MVSARDEDFKVWIRSGARCVLCNTYLLESRLTLRPVKIGEVAHNVGRKRSPRSPRGLSELPEEDRDHAENKLLLCPTCHEEIDHRRQLEEFPEDWLRQRKQEHEAEVRRLTGLVGDRHTVIVRMMGAVRSAPAELAVDEAAQAVLAHGRVPSAPLSADGLGVEIDLRHTAGQREPDAAYFVAATRHIDETLDLRLKPAIANDKVAHLSVFAIARLPLLVYLGSRLDDTIPTDVYQRHRRTESWIWAADGAHVEFVHRLQRAGHGDEAVLIVNASGTIHVDEVSSHLVRLPHFVIEPKTALPHPDTVATPSTLESFSAALRELHATIEMSHKHIRKLHVFAAAPVSVAVTLGRATGWGIHPTLTIYERTNEATYRPGMEVTPP